MIKKHFKQLMVMLPIGLSIISLPTETFAGRFQAFNGISYRNPAELSLIVNDMQIIGGDSWVMPKGQFNGTVTVPKFPTPAGQPSVTTTGRAAMTGTTFDLPYGRIAKRLTSQCVVSLDFTEPFAVTIKYPMNSVVRYAGTEFKLDVKDIAPTIAYQFNNGPLSNLLIGAALDTYYVNVTLNQQYPSLPVVIPGQGLKNFGTRADISFNNNASGREYGWHAGAMYHLFKPTYIGLSYFSKISPLLQGNSAFANSTYSGTTSSNNLHASLTLPPTTNLSIMQYFSPRLMAEFNIYYTQWSEVPNLVAYNAAGPSPTISTNFNYRDSWRYSVRDRFNITPKFTLINLFAYERVPTSNSTRTALVPSANNFTAGVSLEYKVTKEAAVGVDYSHIFFPSSSAVAHTGTDGTTTTGSMNNVAVNVVGARFTINV